MTRMNKVVTWLFVTCCMLLVPVVAFAAGEGTPVGPTPITNLKNWLMPQLKDAFLLVLAGLAVYSFIKRSYAALIGLVVAAVVVAVMIYSPETIGTWGDAVGKLLFKSASNGG